MGTSFPDLFEALTKPFPAREVFERAAERGGEKTLKYIKPASVKNRLDTVMGPENWSTSYIPVEGGVECRLTLRMSDGREVTKGGVGSGKDVKAAYSDAEKRAAEEWGIGRYLRNLGRPCYAPPGDAAEPAAGGESEPPPARRPADPPSQARPAPTGDHTSPVHNRPAAGNGHGDNAPATGRALWAWACRQKEESGFDIAGYLQEWGKLQDYPRRMVEFDAKQVAFAYAEGCRKLQSTGVPA